MKWLLDQHQKGAKVAFGKSTNSGTASAQINLICSVQPPKVRFGASRRDFVQGACEGAHFGWQRENLDRALFTAPVNVQVGLLDSAK